MLTYIRPLLEERPPGPEVLRSPGSLLPWLLVQLHPPEAVRIGRLHGARHRLELLAQAGGLGRDDMVELQVPLIGRVGGALAVHRLAGVVVQELLA